MWVTGSANRSRPASAASSRAAAINCRLVEAESAAAGFVIATTLQKSRQNARPAAQPVMATPHVH
jgi:hypothetical protein